ncbi:unnamed protein product [Amoebophrya sp. A25]|nr:unnamed protein product [Amoebophrya sp. A25]|eukprot:GSA25T00026400001.1
MSAVRNPTEDKSPLRFTQECSISILSLMHVFSQTKKAPPFCFSLFLAIWAAWWLETFEVIDTQTWVLPSSAVLSPILRQQTVGGTSTSSSGTSTPSPSSSPPDDIDWSGAALHWIKPYCGFLRTCLIGSVLLIYGYTYEALIGTAAFLMNFLLLHAFAIGLTAWFDLERYVGGAIFGLECTLVAMQCLYHEQNPKIGPHQIRDDFLQVKLFTLEPRWHVWWLLVLLLLTGQTAPWPLVLAKYSVGLAMGTLQVARYPTTWPHIQSLFARNGQFAFCLLLFALSLVYLPLTAVEPPSSIPGLLEGAFGTPQLSLVSIGTFLEPMPEAYFVIKFTLALLPMIVCLTVNDQTGGFAWIKKAYGVTSMILAMYAMNTKVWNYVNSGFLGLLLCVYGFMTC